MRVHLNERTISSIGTRSEKIYDHNTEEKPNYSKRVRDELVAQFVFTLMIILSNFIPTLHVAALILLFKSLTNFPRERNPNETTYQEIIKHLNIRKRRKRWRERKRRRKREKKWIHTRQMIKQILIILTATYISDTLVRRSAVNLKINCRSEDRLSITNGKPCTV